MKIKESRKASKARKARKAEAPVENEVRTAAYEIIKAKGSTY